MVRLPVRIGFALGSFTYGGAEHDVIQLITRSDPKVIQCVGIAVQTAYPLCPDLPIDHPRLPIIYQPDTQTRHHKIRGNDSFQESVARLAEQADVLVSWGVPDLDRAVPSTFQGRLVITSKCSGTFQEDFLKRNVLLTRNYVANSCKSIEGFPPAMRHLVEVIYTGIDPQRLAETISRDDLRQAWGLRPQDRVVGFLGRIAEDKGVERIVHAVRKLDPRWQAVFVGLTGSFPEYERKFEKLCQARLPGRHRLVPWRSDVGNVLRALDVLAYPSKDEGFANSLAEAWLTGTPTVATLGCGALAEDPWRTCSITVKPDCSHTELGAAIEAAFGNRSLIARARHHAEKLTVESTVGAWQDYLTRVASTPRRVRVMVLLPNLLIGGIQSWLQSLMRHTPEIDWVCLCVVSETVGFDGDPRLADDVLKLGCPIIGIPLSADCEVRSRLEEVMRQTRPDVVLQSAVRHLDRIYPDCKIPLVTVSHGPGESTWAMEVLADSSRKAARCMAVSQSAVMAYPLEYRRYVKIIPNGVEPPPPREARAAMRSEARQKLCIDDRQIAVGFLGRLSPEKRPEIVARAVAELPDNFCAVFIGPAGPDILSNVDRITKRYRHLPSVRPHETQQWLSGLDVLVCPSEFESFGLAIVEAWAFNLPVVATPVGVIRELGDQFDVAVTVPLSASPANWAQAIRRALREHSQRGPACRRLAQRRFHAARMGAKWQKLFQSLAGSLTNAFRRETSSIKAHRLTVTETPQVSGAPGSQN